MTTKKVSKKKKDVKVKLPKVRFRMPSMYSEAGNAYAILGLWQHAAEKAKWPRSSINEVLSEATSSDYDHLRATIREYIK